MKLKPIVINAFVFCILFLISSNLFGKNSDIIKKISNDEQLSLQYISNLNISNLTKEIQSTFIELEPQARLYRIGNDFALIREELISVPSPTGFELTSPILSKSITLDNIQSGIDRAIADNIPYFEPHNIANNLQISPINLVAIEYVGIGGNRHLAKLYILSAYFSTSTQTTFVPKSININIKFSELILPKDPSPINNIGLNNSINYEETQIFVINEVISKRKILPKLQSDNKQFVRIEVAEEGIYKIDASQLSSLGINLSQIEINTIKILGNGGKPLSENVNLGQQELHKEQEIIVNTKTDGSLENIQFYGATTSGFEIRHGEVSRYNNPYSNHNYYILTWGGANGKRAEALEPPSGEVELKPTTYYHRIYKEEELTNPFTKPAGRTWFGSSMFPITLTDVLHNLDRTQPVYATFALAHRAGSWGSFAISQNGTKIQDLGVSSVAIKGYGHAKRGFAKVAFNSSIIGSDNRSVFRVEYENEGSSTTAIPFFDYYHIAYPRNFYAIDNELGFYSNTEQNGIIEYNINGFEGNLIGYDLTDIRNPKLLKNLSSTNGLYIFRAVSDSILHRYYISGKTKSAKLEVDQFENILADNGENAILITHQSLLNSANKFKEYRESNSDYKIKIVTTESIYNELNSGAQDLAAIRNYLQYANENWKNPLQSIILWGDGHFDFRGVQYKTNNFVPSYQSMDEDLDYYSETDDSYATDDFFACLVGNDNMPDVPFGRITINSDKEGLETINKIEHYENVSSIDDWRMRLLLMADDGIGENYEGDLHTNYSENLFRNNVPDELITDRVYLVDYPSENIPGGKRKPAATEAMLYYMNNKGAVVWNYIGHGNPRVLSHEETFNRDVHVSKFTNIDKLTFMVGATCDFGRFDDPDIKSGAEELFLSKSGGVIGVVTASRVVYGSYNDQINQLLFKKLFYRNPETNQYCSIGEAVLLVKQTYFRTNDRKFFLLGDPTMKLLLPEYKINITSINENQVADTSQIVHLKGLEKVEIKGEIINPQTEQIAEDFNGNVWVTMYDGDNYIQTYDNTANSDTYRFQRIGAALNRTTVEVVNGKFTASFLIPQDISFSDSLGRIYAYAISEKNIYAKGATRKFIIDGISTTDIVDKNPPAVEIFLDSRNFKSGDVVSTNPLLIVDLYDESGINSTGLGIGHLTECWIDNNPNSINLTNELKNSFDKPNYSTIEIVLNGLSAGIHTLKLRTWDVFNNFTIKEVAFTIPDSNAAGVIKNELIFPNPFTSGGVAVRFNHNLAPPVYGKMIIYNLLGQVVQEIEKTFTNYNSAEFNWNVKDINGSDISKGAYYFQIILQNETENTAKSHSIYGILNK